MKVIRRKTSRIKSKAKINGDKLKKKRNVKLWRGGVSRMNAIAERHVSEDDIQLTCLTEISKVIQGIIKKNDWTSEEYEKSFGLVRHKNVKRKN